MRYRVKFCERLVYEAEFDSDLDVEALRESMGQNGSPLWFETLDSQNSDWSQACTVDDRELTSLEELPDDVECRFCHEPSSSRTAHRHQLGWVCENCWDERLRSSE